MTTPCVETTWPRDSKGYGLKYHEGRNWRAHRFAWTQANGPIPVGLLVMHECDNPPCINPDHLRVGTHADNIADRDAKGRTATGDRNGATHRRGVPRKGRTSPKPGELNGRAIITADDARRIRLLRAEGRTLAAIGAIYGLNPKTIWRIEKRLLWAHV